MFNAHRLTTLSVFIIILLLLHTGAKDSAAQQTGTLTGTITTLDGKPVNANSGLIATGVFVNLQEHSRAISYNPGNFRRRGVFNDVENGQSRVSSDLSKGGLYTFRNLRPGVYNLVVEECVLPDSSNRGYNYYRPQRIVGIVVKPGQETVFDIIMNPGDKLQQSGNPKNNTLEMIGEPRGNTQEGLKWGWIEGTVTNSEGQPVWSSKTLLVSGVTLTLKDSAGKQVTLQTDHLAGGFYSTFDLKPGTYDVILEKGIRYNAGYRPLIIGQVMIKPGVRTVVNISVNPGDALERVKASNIITQRVALAAK